MFDRLRARYTRSRTLEMVSSLDEHLRRDIGMHESHSARTPRAPVLLMSHGPFERYPR